MSLEAALSVGLRESTQGPSGKHMTGVQGEGQVREVAGGIVGGGRGGVFGREGEHSTGGEATCFTSSGCGAREGNVLPFLTNGWGRCRGGGREGQVAWSVPLLAPDRSCHLLSALISVQFL